MKRLVFLLLAFATLVSCGNAQNKQPMNQSGKKAALEVLYFHGAQRCVTCKAIESLTKEVLDNEYADAMKSGNLVFKVIDISKSENEAIADKYEVAWSSLILDKGGKVVNISDLGFSYAKSQPETFKIKLREELNKLLN